ISTRRPGRPQARRLPSADGQSRRCHPVDTDRAGDSNNLGRRRIHTEGPEPGMSDIPDATLLERFRSGAEQALETLFARYEVPLVQFLVGILRNHHQAEDVLQETFVRALERLDGVDADHLRGWLFTVAYHQAMLARRRQKSRPAGALDDSTAVMDRG